MRFIELDLSQTNHELLGHQVGYFTLNIADDTKAYMIIDIDTTTQDLGLAVWFSPIKYYIPYPFSSFLHKHNVQQTAPLVLSISSIKDTDIKNVQVDNGTYFFNIENVTGQLKKFSLMEVQP